ncbi:unnamed protein product [Prorocentrum cordatum]|uniref:Phosphate transporter n=1 Tax=Prorocentrum cordatum TaxID=2364126 RepID=A0ABN9QFY3_9DINO|nr:unnamed protein product [Polarella glacialis]
MGRQRAAATLAVLLALTLCWGAGGQGCVPPAWVAEVECVEGAKTVDCAFCGGAGIAAPNSTCAPAPGPGADSRAGRLAILVLGSVAACALSVAIGGNNAGEAWGSAVGSGAIGIRAGCLLGGLGELLGSALLGTGVSGTLQEFVVEPGGEGCWACGLCTSKMGTHELGMLAALCGAVVYLMGATLLGMPVSSTHVVVAGVVGMTWSSVGSGCLNWSPLEGGLGSIALSWVVSPILAGISGMAMYVSTHFLIFKSGDPVKAAFVAVPCMYGITSAMLLYLTLLISPMTATSFKWGPRMLVSIATLFTVPFVVNRSVMPHVKLEVSYARKVYEAKARAHEAEEVGRVTGALRASQHLGDCPARPAREDPCQREAQRPADGERGLRLFAPSAPTVEQALAKCCFKRLLVFNAFLESFAIGANDTANATGPFGAIYGAYNSGVYACDLEPTPWWVMLIAGLFVFVGVNTFGHRVIRTVGEGLCSLDYHVGYCVEWASASAVFAATLMHLPVSTTCCQISAVVCVGVAAAGLEGVSWRMLSRIALTWAATLPCAGLLAALLTKLYS